MTTPPPYTATRPAIRWPSRWRSLRVARTRSARALTLTIRPLDAVVLAIDSARRSGTALYCRGRLVTLGECRGRKQAERADTIRAAVRQASALGLPLALALESPYGGTLRTLLSLHATVELWRDSWLAEQQPASHILEMQAGAWREVIFGTARMPRDLARRIEMLTAERILARDELQARAIGADAAAAICLGHVARSSLALQEALGCELVPTNLRRSRLPARLR